MLFSLLYFVVRRLLRSGRRPADEMDIELLVLRHEMKVLQWRAKRSLARAPIPAPRCGRRPDPRLGRLSRQRSIGSTE
jgi:hypothetical protein